MPEGLLPHRESVHTIGIHHKHRTEFEEGMEGNGLNADGQQQLGTAF